MPFKSKKQETYLKINEPKVYKKWKNDYEEGGININIPGGDVNFTEKDVTATVQSGPTWMQLNKGYERKGDASFLIEQELDVSEDGRVSIQAWDREGRGGAGAEITFQNENVSLNAGRDNKENFVSLQGRIPFEDGGMNGCPMDGAVMKGGTKIKPDRYKHGKKKV